MNKFKSMEVFIMVAIGLLIGQVTIIGEYSEYIIMPALIIMLSLLFIQIPINEIGKSFRNTKFTISAIMINFVWTPIIVFIIGKLFLSNNVELLIGFVMLMVTPCTDWYLIFTERAKGNVALGASLLPLNFILQLVLLPVYVFIIVGSGVSMEIGSIVFDIALTLLIPIISTIVFKKLLVSKFGKENFEEKILSKLNNFQGYFLNIAIIAMFASQGEILLANPQVLFKLLIPVLLFFIINFIFVQSVSRRLNLNYPDSAALTLTTLARNSPVAIAIAFVTFPDRELISLALIIGPLIELPVLYLVSKILIAKSSGNVFKKIKCVI